MKIENKQKITPFLWFDSQAEEVAKFYISVFGSGEIKSIARYTEAGPGPEGSVMTVAFEVAGLEFMALNGGPYFPFTEAVSFAVGCDTQEEIDYFWKALSDGGQEVECGWVKDRYGLSWQIVPADINRFYDTDDTASAARVMTAMRGMKKLNMEELERARVSSLEKA